MKFRIISEIDCISGKTFMEVEQTRDLTGLELFGLVGGYLGMFLGGTLVQIPDLVLRLSKMSKK